MGTRTALRQSAVVTFGVMVATAWTLLITYEVATAFDWARWTSGDYVGQTAVSGIVGMLVLVVTLGLLVTLYGEASAGEPAPEPWPPAE
jgi:hypothetical protein